MVLYGINVIREALRSSRCQLREVLAAERGGVQGLTDLLSTALSHGVTVRRVDRAMLDSLTGNAPHQGVAGLLDHFPYADLATILTGNTGTPLLLIVDGIQDPRNLGALIRSADACGVWGVVIPKDRAAGVSPVVAKSSAGALFHVPVMRATNLHRVLVQLKRQGLWIIGTAAGVPADLYQHDLTVPLAVVIGSEATGLRRLIRDTCDFVVSLPMRGAVTSLNASVAGAVVLYEVMRQRSILTPKQGTRPGRRPVREA